MNPSASYASQPPQLLHNLQVGASLPPATHQPQSVSQPPPMPPQPVPKYEDDEYSGQPPPVPLAEQQAQPSAGLAQDDPAAAALLVARLEPHSAVQDGRKYRYAPPHISPTSFFRNKCSQCFTVLVGSQILWRWLIGDRHSLDVVQQPMRARMCGFGDKVSMPESLFCKGAPCPRRHSSNAHRGDRIAGPSPHHLVSGW